VGPGDNDKQVGPWQWFFSDGSLQFAGAYVAGGLRDGTWKAWHANGKLASEGAYQFDRQNGGWRSWHDNRAVFAEGTFDYLVGTQLERQWRRAHRQHHLRRRWHPERPPAQP
jgi:antitoxin component YwqK of YwqJK toxin-antitoxin module